MKLKRLFGRLLYVLIGKHLPHSYRSKASKKFRGFCTKLMLKSCGKNINIGKGSTFSWRISIGDNSSIGAFSTIYGETHIGKNVMMGADVNIYTQNHSFNDLSKPMCEQGMQEEKPVIIEDDVWIGGQVIILPGVTIKKGAIIGAGTVVTKDVPEYAIFCGNPGVVKKSRRNLNV